MNQQHEPPPPSHCLELVCQGMIEFFKIAFTGVILSPFKHFYYIVYPYVFFYIMKACILAQSVWGDLEVPKSIFTLFLPHYHLVITESSRLE